MFAHTIKTAQVIAFVFISVAASALPYIQPINDRSSANDGQGNFEPIAAAHMQLDVLKEETGGMKFSVAVVNPFAKPATIMVCKGKNVLYFETGVKGQYKVLFNLDDLEDGNYQIVFTSGKETISKDININTATTTDRQTATATDRQAQVN